MPFMQVAFVVTQSRNAWVLLEEMHFEKLCSYLLDLWKLYKLKIRFYSDQTVIMLLTLFYLRLLFNSRFPIVRIPFLLIHCCWSLSGGCVLLLLRIWSCTMCCSAITQLPQCSIATLAVAACVASVLWQSKSSYLKLSFHLSKIQKNALQ